MKMYKISIVIPVYKTEPFIERCVRSLFGQTLDSIEYIFVDDCSPDNSIAVMQKVLAEYPNRKEQVKIIRHEVNQGVGAARNHGVAACTGDYIIHCDSDDWVDVNMYESMYSKAVETEADMVYCSVAKVDVSEKQKILFDAGKNYSHDELFSSFVQYGYLINKLYKREIALSADLIVPDNICMCEDLLRIMQMNVMCKKIIPCDSVSYYYFSNSNSITQRDTPSITQIKNMQDVEHILLKHLPVSYHKYLTNFHVFLSLSLIKTGSITTKVFRHRMKELNLSFDSVADSSLANKSLYYCAYFSCGAAYLLATMLFKIRRFLFANYRNLQMV